MSKTNYRRCVGLGVTGRNTETCFPAAIDQLMSNCRVSPDYYEWYSRAMKLVFALNKREVNPFLKDLYSDLEDEIDGELRYEVADSPQNLRKFARAALRAGGAIVVDLAHVESKNVTHAVGLEPVDPQCAKYRLRSTNIPYPLRGVVSNERIFSFMHKPRGAQGLWYPFDNANVTLIDV